MMITATELKKNLGKYLEFAKDEDIIITKNNKEIARLTPPKDVRLDLLNSIVGIMKDNTINDKDARNSFIKDQYNI